MFLANERFAFTAALEQAFPTFRRELDALDPGDFALWPQRDAYQGAWRVFPLFFASLPAELNVDLDENQRKCPESTRMLRAIPDIVGAGFSWLDPGTHIYRHVDAKDPYVIRCHLGLKTTRGAFVRVAGATGEWIEGKCLLFDGRRHHEVANGGLEPRIVLLADFKISPTLAWDMGILESEEAADARAQSG
jgi:beta-hydroxylase